MLSIDGKKGWQRLFPTTEFHMTTSPMMTQALSLSTLMLLVACVALPRGPEIKTAERFTWRDAPVIDVLGLEPETDYWLNLERASAYTPTATERSSTLYRSDANGRIDTSVTLAKDEPTADPYFPIRSMSYADEPSQVQPGRLKIDLLTSTGEPVTSRTIGIGTDPASYTEFALGAEFPGAFVWRRVEADAAEPILFVLGGSEGGDGGARYGSPAFVEAGYTVIGLPYYSPAWFGNSAAIPDLPRAFADLPIDYLERAVMAARQLDGVNPDSVQLMGTSKGAEYVLLASSLISDDSAGGGFCSVVANVPSDVVWEGWGAGANAGETSGFSWRGEPLDFVPYTDIGRALAARGRDDDYTMSDAHALGRKDNPDRVEPARIFVERIDEPVLVVGGDMDTVWPSGEMSRAIKTTRDVHGLETEAYIYPKAGHGSGGNPLRRGGQDNLAAQLENYPATFDFLARHARRDDCRD